jgi:predicted acylesterase/phospholipase RssA
MSEPLNIDLVFEGGGIKGVAFIGALRALAAYGYQPGRLLGASVGSLIATLLAVGYSADELNEQIFDTETKELRMTKHFKPFPAFDITQIDASATRRLLEAIDLPLPNGLESGIDTMLARSLMRNPRLRSFFDLIERAGKMDPEPFVKWVIALLDAKIATRTETPAQAMTLAQFHEATGALLTIIAADVTKPTMLILNHITAPDCPIVQAVRMGTAAPTFFPPVVWQAEWGFYRRKELTGDLIVDGALISNFPIELFLSQQPSITAVMGKPDEKAGVLGLLLDESIAVPGAPRFATTELQQALNDLPGLNLFEKVVRTVIEARDRRVIETVTDYIVRLPAMGYAPFNIDLPPEHVQPLLNGGYNAMIAHLETHPSPADSGYFSESAKKQVDNRALQIINIYGNLVQVDQKIGEVSGTVTGVNLGSASEEKR